MLVDGADHARRSWVATPGWARLGTRVSRLAMKWVRQRCQLAPVNTAAMAFFSPWWASEVTSSTPLRPRAVSDRRKASQRRLAQKTLHHFSPTKAPGRHRAGRRVAVARPGIYPGRPACGAGAAGLLGPGVCGLGGADTLNIGYSLWQDCPCIVPPRVSSDTSAADEGDSIPTLSSGGRFSTIPALTAAPRWRVEWLGSLSFPAAGMGPHDLTIC